MKEDITELSDSELSLLVFNDEELYRIRHTTKLYDIINERYEYTDKQYALLLNDLIEDLQNE
jgi:hypothetical protein